MYKYLTTHYLNNNKINNRNDHSLKLSQYYHSQKYISKVYLILYHIGLFFFASRQLKCFSYNVFKLYFGIIHIHLFIFCISRPRCKLLFKDKGDSFHLALMPKCMYHKEMTNNRRRNSYKNYCPLWLFYFINHLN